MLINFLNKVLGGLVQKITLIKIHFIVHHPQLILRINIPLYHLIENKHKI